MDTLDKWVVVNYNDNLKKERLLTFLQFLVNTGRVYGLTIIKPLEIKDSKKPEQEFPALVAKYPNLQMIMCVLPNFSVGLRDQIKMNGDTLCNIVIECVMEQSVQRQTEPILKNIVKNIDSKFRNHVMQRKEILQNMKTEIKLEPEYMKMEIKTETENMKMVIKSEPGDSSVKVKEEPEYSEKEEKRPRVEGDEYDYKLQIKEEKKESEDELSLPIFKRVEESSGYDDLPMASRKKIKGRIQKKVVISEKTVKTCVVSPKEPVGGTSTVSPKVPVSGTSAISSKDPVHGTTSQPQDVAETERQAKFDESVIDLMVKGSMSISDIDCDDFRCLMKSMFPDSQIALMCTFPSRELMIKKLTNRYDKSKDDFNSLILKIHQQVKIKDARIYKEKGENFFNNEEYTKALNQFKKIMDLQMNEKKKKSLKVLLEQMKNLRYLLIKLKKLYTETDDRSIRMKRMNDSSWNNSSSRCGGGSDEESCNVQ